MSGPGMPPFREAFTLPALFLTVAAAGGFRLAADGAVRLMPPSLMTLVLAVMLLGVMARASLLVPERLLGDERNGLENACGAAVLLSLFLASAQLFNSLTPETGLLRVLFVLFFLFLLWNTLAAQPDRVRLLRSLLVVFGGAFVLKHVVLAGMYDPQGGMVKRLVTAVLEGVSLGSLEHTPDAPAVGYVSFFSIGLYFLGLVLLPRRPALALSLREGAPGAALARADRDVLDAEMLAPNRAPVSRPPDR